MGESRAVERFLCDEMLGRLCRYLRAAGYDTALACPGETDARLLIRATAEQRLLLTMDRKIMERKAAGGAATVLPMTDLDGLAAFMAREFGVDWLHAPFTRCLLDNALLRLASEEDAGRVPADARRPGERILICPDCGRVYWPGSHVKRMLGQLQRWRGRGRVEFAP